MRPENGSQAGEESGHTTLLQGAAGLSLENRRPRAELIALCHCLRGGDRQVGIGLFSQATTHRTRGNGLELHPERLRLEIRKNTFPSPLQRIVERLNGLPREVVGSPCLEVFKRAVDESLRDIV